jgi:hypothetical protein
MISPRKMATPLQRPYGPKVVSHNKEMTMRKNTSKIKKTVKQHQEKTHRSVKPPHEIVLHDAPEQIGAVAGRHTGRLAGNVVTELVRPLIRNTGISASDVEAGSRTGFFHTAARLTGGALAVSSILIGAPFIFLVQALNMSLSSGLSSGSGKDDLKMREYRDEKGQIHHHTRTFMRDHAGELRTIAA